MIFKLDLKGKGLKPEDITLMFERLCTSKVMLSAISVEVVDVHSVSSKDGRVDDVPENGHTGNRTSSPKNAV